MIFREHVAYFFREHILSPRILALNLFNLIFLALVVAGGAFGARKGWLGGLAGCLVGATLGVLLLAVSYTLYVRTTGREKKTNAEPER